MGEGKLVLSSNGFFKTCFRNELSFSWMWLLKNAGEGKLCCNTCVSREILTSSITSLLSESDNILKFSSELSSEGASELPIPDTYHYFRSAREFLQKSHILHLLR